MGRRPITTRRGFVFVRRRGRSRQLGQLFNRHIRRRPRSGDRRGIPGRLRQRGRYVLGRLLDRRSRRRHLGGHASRYFGRFRNVKVGAVACGGLGFWLARGFGLAVCDRDVLIRRCRDVLIRRCRDVLIRRCGDVLIRRCGDVLIRRCRDVLIRRCGDVLIRRDRIRLVAGLIACRRFLRTRGQKRERVEVAVWIGSDPDSEMNVRRSRFVRRRRDRADRLALVHKSVLHNSDRAQPDQRDRVTVFGSDRNGASVTRHRAGK